MSYIVIDRNTQEQATEDIWSSWDEAYTWLLKWAKETGNLVKDYRIEETDEEPSNLY
jgi:hypothetical protein